ncbi:PIG-L deacetylase family protein [uncultured Nocardioides sp.]|uniref:PIG-L deacetylase family protein n=1 Tax=uncultured Nocardioides sp. TaxID=198441 RepID=UPI002631646F|nr:PIG-L deacetylase family protein [uncultured Nocardioides sp.]
MTDDNVLIVVAHPDDDVLGCGGTAYRLAQRGVAVRAAILCGQVGARNYRPTDTALADDMARATEILGIGTPILGDFPNIQMNTVPHLELVQFVEGAIVETQATRIFTSHPGDLNDDHRQVSVATQAAARLAQRGTDVPPLRSLHYMEILSATDWAFRGGDVFAPDTFFEIGLDGVDAKTRALAAYRDVMRPYPHPRSPEGLAGLAAVRGGAAGLEHAEAFQTAYLDLGSVVR